MSKQFIHVFSEIGRLKTVMVHRPGKELENLIPDNLTRLLFDDIPYLDEARNEHDQFVQVMEENGVEVLYLEKLVEESLTDETIKEKFIDEWLSEAGVASKAAQQAIKDYLFNMSSTFEMVLKTMEGFQKSEINIEHQEALSDRLETDNPLLVDPMPSLYFTRDPFATIGNGVSLNKMFATTRNRETIYGKYIFQYHPTYGNNHIEKYYDREMAYHIEGGDELVLSEDVLAVGISQRTTAQAIEELAKNLFENSSFKEILAFSIGVNRKFMHLDTVFTMIDYDKFTIHPEIRGDLKVFSLSQDHEGNIHIQEKIDQLDHILAEALGVDHVTLIECGNGNPVTSAREQWNDGSNTLTIAPGEVVVYDRNTVTNEALEAAGITLHKIKGSELVRGRGGPRCMTMPFYREKL